MKKDLITIDWSWPLDWDPDLINGFPISISPG